MLSSRSTGSRPSPGTEHQDPLGQQLGALERKCEHLRNERRREYQWHDARLDRMDKQLTRLRKQLNEHRHRVNTRFDRIQISGQTLWLVGTIAFFGTIISVLIAVAEFAG